MLPYILWCRCCCGGYIIGCCCCGTGSFGGCWGLDLGLEANAAKYTSARTKMEKGALIASMVDSMREEGSLFVKKDAKTQCWFDIGEYKAREKTSHAMRDHIAKSNGGEGTTKRQSKEVVQKKPRKNNKAISTQRTKQPSTFRQKQRNLFCFHNYKARIRA